MVRSMALPPETVELIAETLRQLGKKGGEARAAKLTPARRKAIATKASMAAKKARSVKKDAAA